MVDRLAVGTLPEGLSERLLGRAAERANATPARPDWDDYFFEIARAVSRRSTCPRAQIGVVLVSRDHHIVATGYNGAGPGELHCIDPEVGCWLYADHCVRARHAEKNAVDAAFAMLSASIITDPRGFRRDAPFLSALDITPYIYGPRDVCSHCAGQLAWAGITRAPKTRRS